LAVFVCLQQSDKCSTVRTLPIVVSYTSTHGCDLSLSLPAWLGG